MIFTLAFWKGAAERAIKTFAQAFLAAFGVNVVTLTQVQWMLVLSTAAVATLLSLVTSIGNANFTAGTSKTAVTPAAPVVEPPTQTTINRVLGDDAR